jgi:hypothetical protein
MTPEQAWKIINDVTAMVRLNRQEHQMVLEALQVLKPKDEGEKPVPERGK